MKFERTCPLTSFGQSRASSGWMSDGRASEDHQSSCMSEREHFDMNDDTLRFYLERFRACFDVFDTFLRLIIC